MGLALLFAGIIITPCSNIPSQKSEINWTDVESIQDSWNISHTFNEGDLIKVEVYPAIDWADNLLAADPSVPYPNRPVWVNITDPFGNETEFFCDFATPTGSFPLYLYNVTITESNGLLVGANASLEEEMRGNPRIMGKAASAGKYTARVMGTISPPSALIFQIGEITTWTEYPYSNLLYVGIIVILAGAVLLFYGFKKTKKKSHSKKRKKKELIR